MGNQTPIVWQAGFSRPMANQLFPPLSLSPPFPFQHVPSLSWPCPTPSLQKAPGCSHLPTGCSFSPYCRCLLSGQCLLKCLYSSSVILQASPPPGSPPCPFQLGLGPSPLGFQTLRTHLSSQPYDHSELALLASQALEQNH